MHNAVCMHDLLLCCESSGKSCSPNYPQLRQHFLTYFAKLIAESVTRDWIWMTNAPHENEIIRLPFSTSVLWNYLRFGYILDCIWTSFYFNSHCIFHGISAQVRRIDSFSFLRWKYTLKHPGQPWPRKGSIGAKLHSGSKMTQKSVTLTK